MNVGSLWLLHLRGSLILTVPSQSRDSVTSWPWNGEQCACSDKKHVVFESAPLILTSIISTLAPLHTSIHNTHQQHVIPCHPRPYLLHWRQRQEGKNRGKDCNCGWSGVCVTFSFPFPRTPFLTHSHLLFDSSSLFFLTHHVSLWHISTDYSSTLYYINPKYLPCIP